MGAAAEHRTCALAVFREMIICTCATWTLMPAKGSTPRRELMGLTVHNWQESGCGGDRMRRSATALRSQSLGFPSRIADGQSFATSLGKRSWSSCRGI
jgi:hypothetical protein